VYRSEEQAEPVTTQTGSAATRPQAPRRAVAPLFNARIALASSVYDASVDRYPDDGRPTDDTSVAAAPA
jgi:hypothetical protein